MHLRLFFLFAAALPFCLQAEAQTAQRVRITSAAIATALKQTGFEVGPDAIQLPAELTSATDQPGLHMVAADAMAEGRMRVHLACRSPSECQPFLVTVCINAQQEQGRQQPGSLPEKTAAAHEAPSSLSRHALVRPGQKLTFFLEDSHMRIAIPAVVIDSGALDEEIRVSSLDHKTIFHGVVVSDQAVRGVLR